MSRARAAASSAAAVRARAAVRLAALRAAARERLATLRARPRPAPRLPADRAALTAQRRARARRRIAAAALVLAALLLLLLRACSCAPPPQAPAPLVCPDVPVCTPAPSGPAAGAPTRPTGRVAARARGAVAVPGQPAPPWLAAFRMQVTARSRALAVCFNGVNKPGALRWSTTVNAARGTVADSVLEPVLRGSALSATQQACVVRALTQPGYRLAPSTASDVGERVSLVLEF